MSEPFGIEAFTGAFVGAKANDEGGITEAFVFEGGRVGALCAKKLGMAGLDGKGPLPEDIGAGLWVAEIGAVGKENEGPGTARVVLFSGLSLVSLGRVSEDNVGNLKSKGVLVEPAACVLALGGWATENAGVVVWVTGGFSSDFASVEGGANGKANAAFVASTAFASASAFAFSSAFRRRRAIASASISCFSHFE